MTLSATAQRYYPQAIQMPGPPGKVYPEENTVEGVIMHSMQGDYTPGATSVLFDETVIANRYRAACWHFSILKDGTVYQHYALDKAPFHAGNGLNNRRLIGVEHEGGPPGNLSEPLTEAQVAAGVALLRWMATQAQWRELSRATTLWEHNESTGTVCPSGRIEWHRYVSPVTPQPPVSGTAPIVTPLPGGEFLPEPVEARDIGQIAADLVYGVQSGRVDLVSHGPSPKRAGWTRLTVDYLP